TFHHFVILLSLCWVLTPAKIQARRTVYLPPYIPWLTHSSDIVAMLKLWQDCQFFPPLELLSFHLYNQAKAPILY
ncbi:hypothetical protein B0H19DRAFT_1185440, partial [Mycena capillaripes]